MLYTAAFFKLYDIFSVFWKGLPVVGKVALLDLCFKLYCDPLYFSFCPLLSPAFRDALCFYMADLLVVFVITAGHDNAVCGSSFTLCTFD